MPPRQSNKKLLLIGASRGLGLALAEVYLKRGWSVVATERDARTSGLRLLAQAHAGRLVIETVDIAHPDQVAALRQRLASERFDMLFVNAGVTTPHHESAAEVSTDEFARVMVTNALSPIRAIEALRDLVVDEGTIGVMSSGRGSVANNEDGKEDVYRASKAALNMFMRSFAARHADDSRTLVLMAPGWVRTDMGGPEARLSIAQSIPNLADTMDAQAGKPGLQYLDYLGRRVPW
ncbi:MAG: SDR family NAD(P)-dependent oxidoreductase [Dyella sp.]|uniref:SDR family NAD(P)-dependent oxidoreductase n=1 Tax=Dyella sp. TaxID=1869338 RepID=UPI003F809673